MVNDRNLLFGVVALRENLIDSGQFAAACRRWAENRDRELGDVLIDLGWILRSDKERIAGIISEGGTGQLAATLLHPVAPAPITHQQDGEPNVPTLVQPMPAPATHPVEVEGATVNERAGARSTFEASTRPVGASGQRYTYQIIHAFGGMGRVWLAYDNELNREVALKELRPEVAHDAGLAARFLREARITGRLEHPGIVPVYELARHAETRQPFYTMRFVRGRTLVEASRQFHERRLAGQPDPLELVALLSAFVAVCNTVAYAHSHRVIHRDLKGENILLGDFGEVIVLDWGLAKHLDAVDAGEPGAPATGVPLSGYSDNLDHTMQGDVIGTPGYMAPEQAAGRLDLIDQRSDIYGLGAILYEILAGRPPFRGTTSLETILQVQKGDPAPPRTHWADVPPALEAAALRALAREPAARYQAAAELAQVVQTWQEVQRRQAEDALQRQSEILQSILDNMSEGVVVADNDGQLLLVNPMAKRLLGDDCAQLLLGSRLEGIELLLPDRSTVCCSETAPLARAIHGEVVDDAELFVRLPARPDGLWISANARPLRDKHGRRLGGVVAVRNISERKRAEEELRRSRERFELAVKGSQDGLWDWDLQTDEVFFSPRWKSIIGYEDHEIAHHIREWEIRLHPDEKADVLAANYAHMDGTTPHYEYEYRLRHKDGSYRWILARGAALRDAAGKAYRMAGSHVDVTTRRQVEQDLKDSEDRYRAVLASLEAGILVLDGEGVVRECNASAERLLGLPTGGLLGRASASFLPHALRADGSAMPTFEFPVLTALNTGRPSTCARMGVLRPAGGVCWLAVNAQPLFRPGEARPYAVVASLQEVKKA